MLQQADLNLNTAMIGGEILNPKPLL